jgi:hypothetical protein
VCQKSESIASIAKALVAFSGDIKSIEKDGTNPHFKSSYATLDNMIDETKPLLKKHGLTVMQFPGGDGEKVTVRTMILHESGEYIESEPLTLKAVKMDPQGAGSAITYARRYSYAAALSLSLGDDDDGNAASTLHQQPVQTSKPAQQRQAPPPTNDDLAAIQKASEQNMSGQGQSKATAISARVYALREKLNMPWPALNELASSVLEREIKYLKTAVKTEEEWLKIENALKEAG